MTATRLRTWLGAGLALGLASLLLAPSLAGAFSLIGGELGVGTTGFGYQRDVRVYNNASDATANDNTSVDPQYPGALGASLAVWKGAAAWNSDSPGAGRNFDMDFQGASGGAGGNNGNVVSWGTPGGCGGGVLAFTTTPINDGWKIVFCESGITWADGPGSIGGSQYDIQSVMAHEYGHALGMGHTGVQCSSCGNLSTMCSFICNGQTNQRTIEADDAAGLEANYGTIPANKPLITGISGDLVQGGLLTIQGSGFADKVNVKFSAGSGANVAPIQGVLEDVPSSAGGTELTVVIPGNARPGNVLVWQPAQGLLSNGFPIDVQEAPWATLGGGTSGAAGPPLLSLGGPLTTGSTLSLDLVQGAPSKLALLFVSFSSSPTPFLGGTLHAFPFDELAALATDGAGEIHGAASFPGAPSGTLLYFQVGIEDPSVAGYGASLSNGMRGTVP